MRCANCNINLSTREDSIAVNKENCKGCRCHHPHSSATYSRHTSAKEPCAGAVAAQFSIVFPLTLSHQLSPPLFVSSTIQYTHVISDIRFPCTWKNRLVSSIFDHTIVNIDIGVRRNRTSIVSDLHSLKLWPFDMHDDGMAPLCPERSGIPMALDRVSLLSYVRICQELVLRSRAPHGILLLVPGDVRFRYSKLLLPPRVEPSTLFLLILRPSIISTRSKSVSMSWYY